MGLHSSHCIPAHLRMRPVSRGNSRRATWVRPSDHTLLPRSTCPLLPTPPPPSSHVPDTKGNRSIRQIRKHTPWGHRIQTHSPGSTLHAPLLFGFLPSAVTPHVPTPPTRGTGPLSWGPRSPQDPTGLTTPLLSLVYSLWPALIAGTDLEGSALIIVSAS